MTEIPIHDPYYDRLNSFLDATQKETERGKALVAASLIEEMLEEILRSFLSENKQTQHLFDAPNAPLSTLSAKNLLARSLELITLDEFQDIELVRKIRNEFAHNVMCSFESPKVKDWAKKLSLGMSVLDQLEKGHKSRVKSAKSRFGMVTASIVTSLYNRSYHVKKIKLTSNNFPE